MPEYFDIHSHLNFSQYNDDRGEVIERMREQKVWTITVGANFETSREAVQLAGKYGHLFAIVGVHPTESAEGFDAAEYELLIGHPKVVGVGECGLDYYRAKDSEQKSKETQKQVFKQQIEFALEHDLPLMIHCRPSEDSADAYEDTLSILDPYHKVHGSKLRGNVHFFAGTANMAEEFLKLGFSISFDGPITFSRDYDEAVRRVPLDKIHAETDAPFAAPEPYRGKRNEPVYVKEIVEAIAEIRNEDVQIVKKTLVRNALGAFGITLRK